MADTDAIATATHDRSADWNEVDFIGPHVACCTVARQRAGCPIGGSCVCAEILHPERRSPPYPPGTPPPTFRASMVGVVIR